MAERTGADWQSTFADMARIARVRAEETTDPQLQDTWQYMADDWNYLSDRLFPECFCGRAAIGSKYYVGGEPIPYCRDHLVEAIANDAVGIGIKSLS